MYLFIVFVYLLSSCYQYFMYFIFAESAPAGFPGIAVGVVIAVILAIIVIVTILV